jgi:hypothetical protein
VKAWRAWRAGLAIAALVGTGVRGGADDKPKDKPKTPVPSYSDDDLKKYKDQPKESGADASGGATAPSGDSDEPAPGQRRSREYGGYQKLPPTAPKTQAPAKVDAPPADEPKSPEEADWKARAKQARAPLQEAEGRIKQLEGQIAELRDKLNPMSTTYVLGGNSNAGPGAVLEVEEQIRILDGDLTGARGAVADAEKSWQAFLEEARAAGASPAWLNP